jgi:dienelactone hydrolase
LCILNLSFGNIGNIRFYVKFQKHKRVTPKEHYLWEGKWNMKHGKIFILSFSAFLLIVALESTSYAKVKRISYQVPKNIDLTDIIRDNIEGLEEKTVYGELRMPSSLEGKVPAVVIMHASGGVFEFREIEMAKLLNKNRIAAFIPYSFKARGITKSKQTAGTGVTFGMRICDAYAALNLLSSHPNINRDKIAIMGFSSGGTVSLLSLDEKVRRRLATDGLKFAAHLNVYAGTIFVFKNVEPTKVPVLFLTGEKDNLCPVDKVLEYAQRLKDAGGNIKTILYPGAHHVFDSRSPVKELSMINDGNCQFEILDDGSLVDSATGELFPEKDYPGDHIKPCLEKKGTFGRNNSAAKKYKIDVIDFMTNVLQP